MLLNEVRQWAGERCICAATYRQVYEGALLHSISRLLQAIYRESKLTRLTQNARGRWYLEVGKDPALRVPASGALPFRRIELIGRPWLVAAGKRRRVCSVGAFLAALKRCLAGSEYIPVFDALCADFENSVANVVLNRLIGSSLGAKARALEPAFQGHQYYPFPALRIGPSLSQILACSHLCRKPVDLPLLEIGGCRLISCVYGSFDACLRSWSGLRSGAGAKVLLPVHPWQLQLSPIVRELLATNLASLSQHKIRAIPLASQRTCRIVLTGFDVKLSVDATLTGERRLLYDLNRANAPVISALAKHVRGMCGLRSIDFQADLASLFHTAPALAPHLSVIVRAPVRARVGESIIPAINLWAGREEARTLLRAASPERIEEFFDRYCRALMPGPVQFCAQWGMAFEPHLQNVYIVLRNGLPSRIILRDLDNTLLDARTVRPMLRALGIGLERDTWRHMPSFEMGGMRLVQAMLFGHLGEVIWILSQRYGVASETLACIVEDVWNDIEARAPCASARMAVKQLRGWSNAVKATLRTRLYRATDLAFVRE